MKIYLILFTCLCFAAFRTAAGQATSPQLMEGILLYQGEEYGKAVHYLANLIGEEKIDKEELPKAHYFLGQSYFWLVRENEKFRRRYPLAVARALTHTETAGVLDQGGRYSDLSEASLLELEPYLYNEAVFHYKKEEFPQADYYFGKAIAIMPADYEAILGRSYVALAQADTGRAIKLWLGMTSQMQKIRTDSQPPAMARAYELLSTYYEGEAYDKEEEKLESIALKKSRVEVYKEQALKKEEAALLFEDMLKKYPEDTKTCLAYAELLQLMGREDTAMVLYRQVLRYDSTQVEAHRQLAVHYLNRAVALQESGKNREEVNASLERSWPHFEVLHRQEPQSRLWLEQLVLIGQRLEKDEVATYVDRWEEMEK